MNYKEYKELIEFELYRDFGKEKPNLINRIRIKYFQPNTNCLFLARTMWFLYSRGGFFRFFSKFLYLKILKKYGCCFDVRAKIKKGLRIGHPVAIVIGLCEIDEDFTILHNCTIGVSSPNMNEKQICFPRIGKRVIMSAGSMILGNITIADDCIIGANSTVIRDIDIKGRYVGSPARKVTT